MVIRLAIRFASHPTASSTYKAALLSNRSMAFSIGVGEQRSRRRAARTHAGESYNKNIGGSHGVQTGLERKGNPTVPPI